MNMISFLNTSDRTAWTQTDPEKPLGFSGPVPCLCNTNIPAIDYFLISPPQMLPASYLGATDWNLSLLLYGVSRTFWKLP